MKFFTVFILFAGFTLGAPTALATLNPGERCVCTAKDGSGVTQNYAADSANDCVVNGSSSQWSCSITSTISTTPTTPTTPPVTNQGFTPLAPIPGLTDTETAKTALGNGGNFAAFFNQLYKYLIGVAVALAVIMIVWGGLEYATQDSISKKSDGKSKIQQALFGLALVLSPVLIFTIINPAILNLNINIPPLKTTWGNYVGTPGSGTPGNGTGTPATNSCNTPTGTGLQSVSCGSSGAAQEFAAQCNRNGGIGMVTNFNAGCGGNYTVEGGNRVCTNPTYASALCANYSSGSFLIVNTGSALFADYSAAVSANGTSLDPNSADLQNFKNSCASSGGTIFVNRDAVGNAVTCPNGVHYRDTTRIFPTNGSCYREKVICTPAGMYRSSLVPLN